MAGKKKPEVIRGQFNVFVGRLGAEPVVHRMNPGAKVEDVLKKADLSLKAEDIRLNARPVELNQRVKQDDVITILGRVQGG